MKELTINIRQAGVADARTITDLSVSTFTEAFAKDNRPEDMASYLATEMNLEQLAAELADPENIFWLAEVGGEPIAYCKVRTGHHTDAPEAKKPIELERIYVAGAYQKSGVGQQLLDTCISHALSMGHDVLWLGVWEHNHKALRFYNKHGFVQFGSHPFILGADHQTDVLMKKTLRPQN